MLEKEYAELTEELEGYEKAMRPSVLQAREKEVREWKNKNDASSLALEREHQVFSKMEVEGTKMGREFR